MTTPPPEPTGYCFCGCGTQIGYRRYFAQGHDKAAEAAYIAVHHGASIPAFLAAHGYGPDNSVTLAAVEAGTWQECPKNGCVYRGTEASVRTHLKKHKDGGT
jgi:hypothetical protein